MEISLTELEQAINYWRMLRPASGEERALSAEVNCLAEVYALMIYHRTGTLPLDSLTLEARQLVDAWRQQQVRASA